MIKQIFIFLAISMTCSCKGQSTNHHAELSVSPNIDKTENTNQIIIQTLISFLKTKNLSPSENEFWSTSDFVKYTYPYLDIYNIEQSKYGPDFFRPTLMEIISTENSFQKVIKLAFIGHHPETKENQLKCIYNMIANIENNKVTFSRYLDYYTKTWKTIVKNTLTYKISPNKLVNEKEMSIQEKEIEEVCNFFKSDPIPITYYSCKDAKEVFEIKGFDYHVMMYAEKTGGLADHGNIIFSGNNSEIYTHEIIHIYTNNLYPNINKFLDEGMATFLGGSGKFDYTWHRNKLAKFLNENNAYDFAKHVDPYEKIYFEEETSIPYTTAALIIERTIEKYGKEKLTELFNSTSDIWSILKLTGLTPENINEELRKQIKRNGKY